MELVKLITKDAIVPSLTSTTRDEAIAEVIDSLVNAGKFNENEKADIIAAVLGREQVGTTGIGRGIAIPPSRHAAADNLISTMAISPTGIPFNSIDDEPVFILVLLISPQAQPGEHLRALNAIVAGLSDDGLCERLRNSKTQDEIWDILQESAS